MATKTSVTKGEQTEWMTEMMSQHCLEISESKDKARIVTDGFFVKGPERKKDFLLAPGDSFQGPTDHHASCKIRLESIDNKGLNLSYESSFDHRSFGKDLKTVDKGAFHILFKKAAPEKE